MTALARQVSQQQLYVEEMTRSHGDSGLKLTRLTRTGSKPYFATSFVGGQWALAVTELLCLVVNSYVLLHCSRQLFTQ